MPLAEGLAKLDVIGGEEMLFSQNYACPDCGISIEELTPRMFSFNNPFGACPHCTGLGMLMRVDPSLVVPDERRSLLDGAISVSGWQSDSNNTMARMYFTALSKEYDFSLDTPWLELSDEVKRVLLYGTGERKLHIQYKRDYGSG